MEDLALDVEIINKVFAVNPLAAAQYRAGLAEKENALLKAKLELLELERVKPEPAGSNHV